MDQISKNIASNDEILENISNRMDSVASAIKNQHKILENISI
jgi:archaellum component FlaC